MVLRRLSIHTLGAVLLARPAGWVVRFRHRLTRIRHLIGFIAVIALFLGLLSEARRERRLSGNYARIARNSQLEARWARDARVSFRRMALEAEQRALTLRPRDRELAELWAGQAKDRLREAEAESIRAAYYQNLARKYQNAARTPWARVAPDPPFPRVPHVWHCGFSDSLPEEPLPSEMRWYSQDATDETWERALAAKVFNPAGKP